MRKDDCDLPGVLGLIGPHLKRTSIEDWSRRDDEGQYLQTSLSLISTRFLSLQSFGLHCNQTPEVCKLISKTLPNNLHDLRTFQCDQIPVAESAFLALGRLQHLSDLAIRLPAFLAWAPLPLEAFPALRHMEVTALTRDYLVFSTDVARFLQVRKAVMYLRDVPSVRDGVLFDLISNQFSKIVLSDLSIYMSDDANLGHSRQNKLTLARDNLRPLLSFTNLTALAVNLACPYALDRDFYPEIAQAFPDIELLFIGTYAYCYHNTDPGMLSPMTEVLNPIAIHCPELTTLGIAFDARQTLTVDDIRYALPQRPSLSAVSSLNCSHCPIDDLHVVADTWLACFLCLRGHTLSNGIPMRQGTRWPRGGGYGSVPGLGSRRNSHGSR